VIIINKLKLYNNQNKNKDVTNKKARRARFRLLRLLGQGHNIIAYIRRLLACTKVFKKLVRRMILINNRTR
jgi:hypothetical protein